MKILSLLLGLSLVVLMLMPPAHAEFKKFEMDPPKAKGVNSRRLSRSDAVLMAKMKGYVGETDQGLLAVHEPERLPKAEKKQIEQLVKDENQDRIAWYKEVIAFNKMSEKEKSLLIKSAFNTFKGTDPKGAFYYENKQWQKKY
jgi:uncharacterized protein YdbL (DUF1318 family)